MKTTFRPHRFLNVHPAILAVLCLLTVTACNDDEDQIEEPIPPPSLAAIVLPCDYFDNDSILRNDTLRDVDYIIDCFMYVNDNKRIRIEPGVVVEFGQDAGIYLDDDARMVVEGTAEEPVLLSGTQKGKGFWRGLFLNSSGDNRIHHTRIEYAAGKTFTEYSPVYGGSIAVSSGGSADLSHVEIINGGNTGLDLSGHSAKVRTDHLTITENEGMAVRVAPYHAHIFDNTSTFTGNAFDYVNVLQAYYTIDTVVTWDKLDVPYLVDSRVHVVQDGYLTITAGVEVEFREGAYLQAAGLLPPYEFAMNILGTADEPVRLSGYNGNYWGGLYYSSDAENHLIRHAVIEGAKGDISVGNITNTGAIYMHANPKVTVENTEFKDLPNCAYYFYTGASTNMPDTPNFTAINLTLTNVAGEEFCWGGGSE